VGERWVINASPIILLAKAEVIHLLPSLCDELVIPAGVIDEVEHGSVSDPGRRWLDGIGSEFVRRVSKLHPVLGAWHGGIGEAEVISWALQNPGFIAILDDRRARAFAAENRVPVLGSLRIIVLAKEKGMIPSAKDALERLRGAGAYVSDFLIDHAIRLAGE
jgi:predicted nucleic acid-binding protein